MTTRPRDVAERAARAERDGWDGVCIGDTQCLLAEAFVVMAAAATATSRLNLTLATSNPATRHPAVAASALASVRDIAGNRVRYGLGRGDSALAYLGGAPATVGMLEDYVHAVRSYLRRETVTFESVRRWRLTRDVAEAEFGDAPHESSLAWLPDDYRSVPVDVYATGPRVLGIAGRCADGVVLGVGAEPDRLRWAIEEARGEADRAGRDPGELSIGAVCIIAAHDDVIEARRSIADVVALSARFSSMSGSVVGPVSNESRQVYDAIRRSYDMNRHGATGPQTEALTDEFTDSFAIVGPPSRCVERLQEIIAMGVESIVLGAVVDGSGNPQLQAQYSNLIETVLPAIRDSPRSTNTDGLPSLRPTV